MESSRGRHQGRSEVFSFLHVELMGTEENAFVSKSEIWQMAEMIFLTGKKC